MARPNLSLFANATKVTAAIGLFLGAANEPMPSSILEINKESTILPKISDTSSLGLAGMGPSRSSTDWILDTGASIHVCADRSAMHEYFNLMSPDDGDPPTLQRFGGDFRVVGVGTCQFTLPPKSPPSEIEPSSAWSKFGSGRPTKTEVYVVSNILHEPFAPVNILSWSALKLRNPDSQLIELPDGILIVED
ncbi:hypothetical protein H2200_002937 [Cladophialophora chaetospira]|uniref:Uncharacterized protein n=1 Tax=Cladophialophora chaetospira TaxID=386627 RepID=A0AA39CM70_9EURO|nr:hypothetical protein H2200_002937 [Cladophialophora chaetospira]